MEREGRSLAITNGARGKAFVFSDRENASLPFSDITRELSCEPITFLLIGWRDDRDSSHFESLYRTHLIMLFDDSSHKPHTLGHYLDLLLVVFKDRW